MEKYTLIEELNKIPGREIGLGSIKRYVIYSPMHYRPDVYFHSIKVYCLLLSLKNIIISVYPNFDFKSAELMALVHDDPEIIIGDFQAGHKAKLTDEEVEDLEFFEKEAISKLSNQYPKTINGVNYQKVLSEVFEMGSIESQVVKYLDRYDALCEALHEIYAGNNAFIIPVTNEYGTIELPTEFYFVRFDAHEKNYPMIGELFKLNVVPFLSKYPRLDIIKACNNGSFHTSDSLKAVKGYLPYDYWISSLINNLPRNLVSKLYTRVE